MDYLSKYGVKNYRKFQEGGPAGPPAAAPQEGAPAGGGGEVEAAAQLLMQIAEAAMGGDAQAAEIAVQIAQAIAGGGAEGGGAPMARNGGMVKAPTFAKRSTLLPRQ